MLERISMLHQYVASVCCISVLHQCLANTNHSVVAVNESVLVMGVDHAFFFQLRSFFFGPCTIHEVPPQDSTPVACTICQTACTVCQTA